VGNCLGPTIHNTQIGNFLRYVVAMFIQRLLPWAKAKDAQDFGLTAGTVGSGIGAAHALGFHEMAGAFAGLAIALNGLLTAPVLPLLVHFWPR
jgi:putative effector of murein hydrolase